MQSPQHEAQNDPAAQSFRRDVDANDANAANVTAAFYPHSVKALDTRGFTLTTYQSIIRGKFIIQTQISDLRSAGRQTASKSD